VVAFSLPVSILVWYTTRAGTVFRTVFILPMTISLAAAGVIWSFVYNADPQIGVLNAVLDRLGILGADWRLGPLELHPGSWLSNPGVLHLGFADIRLTNLALIVPAFWAFTGFGVITITAGLTAVPYELVEASKVDGANAWQTARHILVPALRRPLVVVGVVSVIFALRTFDIVYVMTGGGPAQDTMVLALLLWQQAFAFLDTPQGGQATAIAVLMSAVLVAGSWRYLRQLLAGRSR
jgi:alpha-glucoside transport system permease protein